MMTIELVDYTDEELEEMYEMHMDKKRKEIELEFGTRREMNVERMAENGR
jgi:hypothetical protein